MPSKRRERGLGLTMLVGMAVGGAQPVFAQMQTLQAPPQTTAPLNRIQPTLNMQALVTSNSELAKGSTAPGKTEMVLSVTPGIGFQLKGAQAELIGQFQLEGLRYIRGTQADRILPSGDVRLKLEAVKDAVGVEASLRAMQVRADTTAQQASSGSAANAYTDTTLHIAPYLRSRLDANTIAEVKLDRGMLDSTQITDLPPGGVNNGLQRDALTSDDRIRVLRRPSPLGYDIQLLEKSERYRNTPTPALEQREASAALLLAPDPEVTVGLKLLHAQDELRGSEFSKTSVGYQAQWRPTPRSLFQAETEDRSYGRTWMADLQHRWRLVSAGIRAERVATSYAREAARSAVVLPPLSSGTPTPPSTGAPGVQEPPQPFDTGAQIRQAIQGRMLVMGVRNQVNFAAGLVKTASLLVSNTGELSAGGRRTREYYFETQFTHKLTPANELAGALRWGRVLTTQPLTGDGVLSRDFVMRAAINTKLTPDTTATMGLKRQITHNSQITSANETAGYVGLGHRF